MKSEEFELADSDGELHTYRVDMHPSREGSGLMLQLCSLLSEPALQVIRLFVAEMEDEGVSAGDVDIGELLDKADMADLGGALRQALTALGPDDLHAFFAYTYRDGEPLRKSAEYDKAYAGNWGEWMKAIWRIIQANGFVDFLSSMLSS